jgi:predicted nucleic acid-binding protein
MGRFVIDTNVLSELSRPKPSQRVLDFLSASTDAWVCAATFHEMAFGVARMRDEARKLKISSFIDVFKSRFSGRIVPVDLDITETSGRLRAFAAIQGRTLTEMDSFMAATAAAKDAILATRNTKDFEQLGIGLVNPWTA